MKCFLGNPAYRHSDSEPHTKGKWSSTLSTLTGRQKEETEKSLEGHGPGKTKTVSDKVEGKAQHRKLPLTSTMACRYSHMCKETHTQEYKVTAAAFHSRTQRQERDLKASPAKKNWPSRRESDASPFHIVFLSTLTSK